MWHFAIGLYLVELTPGSLRLTAIYQLISTLSIILFGPLVGDWVDANPRLKGKHLLLWNQQSNNWQGIQWPNILKFVKCVLDGFLYAFEVCLVNMSYPKTSLSVWMSQGNFGHLEIFWWLIFLSHLKLLDTLVGLGLTFIRKFEGRFFCLCIEIFRRPFFFNNDRKSEKRR